MERFEAKGIVLEVAKAAGIELRSVRFEPGPSVYSLFKLPYHLSKDRDLVIAPAFANYLSADAFAFTLFRSFVGSASPEFKFAKRLVLTAAIALGLLSGWTIVTKLGFAWSTVVLALPIIVLASLVYLLLFGMPLERLRSSFSLRKALRRYGLSAAEESVRQLREFDLSGEVPATWPKPIRTETELAKVRKAAKRMGLT